MLEKKVLHSTTVSEPRRSVSAQRQKPREYIVQDRPALKWGQIAPEPQGPLRDPIKSQNGNLSDTR